MHTYYIHEYIRDWWLQGNTPTCMRMRANTYKYLQMLTNTNKSDEYTQMYTTTYKYTHNLKIQPKTHNLMFNAYILYVSYIMDAHMGKPRKFTEIHLSIHT